MKKKIIRFLIWWLVCILVVIAFLMIKNYYIEKKIWDSNELWTDIYRCMKRVKQKNNWRIVKVDSYEMNSNVDWKIVVVQWEINNYFWDNIEFFCSKPIKYIEFEDMVIWIQDYHR